MKVGGSTDTDVATQDDALCRFIIMADVDIVLAGASIERPPAKRSTLTGTNLNQRTVTNHSFEQYRFADIPERRQQRPGRL